MKNIKYLILISFFSILLCGCSNNYNIDKMNNNILELFSNENYVDSSLNKNEKELLNNFIESEQKDNKLINLNKYFTEYNKTSETDSPNIIQDKDQYYIKYSDLDFIDETGEDYDTGNTKVAYLVCNGYDIEIPIEDITILYDDTKDNERYNYIFLGTKETDNEILSYYSSYYDSTGLIIKYTLENKKITNIDLIYELSSSYAVEETNNNEKIANAIKIGTLSAGVLMGVYFIIKKVKNANVF